MTVFDFIAGLQSFSAAWIAAYMCCATTFTSSGSDNSEGFTSWGEYEYELHCRYLLGSKFLKSLYPSLICKWAWVLKKIEAFLEGHYCAYVYWPTQPLNYFSVVSCWVWLLSMIIECMFNVLSSTIIDRRACVSKQLVRWPYISLTNI